MPVKPATTCSVGLEVAVEAVAPVTTLVLDGLEVVFRVPGRSTGNRCEPPCPVCGRRATVTVRTGNAMTVVRWSLGRSAAPMGAVPNSEIEPAAITALNTARSFKPTSPVQVRDAIERWQ